MIKNKRKNKSSFVLTVCLMAALIVALMVPTTIAWFTDSEVKQSNLKVNFGSVNVGIYAPKGNEEGALTNKNSPTQRALTNLLPGDKLEANVQIYNAGNVPVYAKASLAVEIYYNGLPITGVLAPHMQTSITAPDGTFIDDSSVIDLDTSKTQGNGINITVTVKILTTLPNELAGYVFNGQSATIKLNVITKAAAIQKNNYNFTTLETLDADLTAIIGTANTDYKVEVDQNTQEPTLYKDGQKIETISASVVSPTSSQNTVVAYIPQENDTTIIIAGEGETKNNTTTSTIAPTQKTTIKEVVVSDGVENLGSYSFYNYPAVEEVNLAGATDLETIGDHAFTGCSNLTTVTLPSSVKTIGSYAFYHCTNLNSITIPNGVETIQSYAFKNCALETIVLPSTVKTIESYAFDACANLKTIVLNEGLETIGDYAFYNCSALEAINIPSTVTNIGVAAFSNPKITSLTVNENNETYYSEGNSVITKATPKKLVAGCTTSVIPNDVQIIGWGAFQSCTGLTQLTLPLSLTTIEAYAFIYCTGLTSIQIPANVSSIGQGALANMDLAYLSVASGNTTFTSKNNCIIKEGTLIAGCKNSIIPTDSTVTAIGAGAFQNCRGLSGTFTIPSSISSIASWAFHGTRVTEYILPTNLQNVGANAFGNPNLLGFRFSNGSSENSYFLLEEEVSEHTGIYKLLVKKGGALIAGAKNTSLVRYSVSSGAFYGAGILEGLTFENINFIYSDAFAGCTISEVVIPSSVNTIGQRAFATSSKTNIFMRHTSDAGLALSENWHGGNPVYYYSETEKAGCWHYAADGTTPTLW